MSTPNVQIFIIYFYYNFTFNEVNNYIESKALNVNYIIHYMHIRL
jgi:hypothetical protein